MASIESMVSPDKGEAVTRTSSDPFVGRLAQLHDLFPELFVEGKIDIDRLRATLGDAIDDRPERYSFSWSGKKDAIGTLQVPSYATLVPQRDRSVEFDTSQHLFIEGDNLEVLKLLYKAYFGRIKMIFIDPPYNTGNDFIYSDNFTDPRENYLHTTGQTDNSGNLLTSNPETSGRYHSAWLSMLYPRLFLAHQLLRDDGCIFVSIDDHEITDLRMLMNEIFGEENFVATVIWQKIFSPKNTARQFSVDHDYIVVFAKNASRWTPLPLPRTEEADARYSNPDNDARGIWSSSDLTARNYYSEGQYEATGPTGKTFKPSIGAYWRVSHDKFMALNADNRIWWGARGDNMPRLKRFLTDVKQGIVPQTLWMHEDVGNTQEAKKELLEHVKFEHTDNVLDTVKPTRLIRRMLQLATQPSEGDIVLDFFSGSASTAHAVLVQNRADGGNRRSISVQFPEALPKPETVLKTIADIGRERIRNVGAGMKQSDEGKLDGLIDGTAEDLGFKAFRVAPSNYRAWTKLDAADANSYANQMALFNDPLVEGWTSENVIYEVALKEGYGLNVIIERMPEIHGKTIYRVTDPDREQMFYISLDDDIPFTVLKPLSVSKDDLFICRDVALDDDAAANLALQCRLKTI